MVFSTNKELRERDLGKFARPGMKEDDADRAYTDSDIDRIMAKTYGGKSESKEKKKARFSISPATKERFSSGVESVKSGLKKADKGAQRIARGFDAAADYSSDLGVDYDMNFGGMADNLFSFQEPTERRSGKKGKKGRRRESNPYEFSWF